MKKPKKNKVIKKEVCEIFKVPVKKSKGKADSSNESKKNSKEKTIRSCGTIEEKVSNKEQIKNQDKILRNFFIGLGIIIIFLVAWLLFSYFQNNFTYQGIKFNTIQEGKLKLYHARIPVFYQGKNVHYNLYLRKNPKKSKLDFKDELNLKEMLVLNATDELKCNGDGIVGVSNLVQSLNVLGTKTINDKNASCDSLGRYSFINILPGEETKIEKFGPSCYNLYVNDCEILDVTEKFIVESFVQYNKLNSDE